MAVTAILKSSMEGGLYFWIDLNAFAVVKIMEWHASQQSVWQANLAL